MIIAQWSGCKKLPHPATHYYFINPTPSTLINPSGYTRINKAKTEALASVRAHWLSQYNLNIPLFFNKEYMQQMAQRLALIKLMQSLEEKEIT